MVRISQDGVRAGTFPDSMEVATFLFTHFIPPPNTADLDSTQNQLIDDFSSEEMVSHTGPIELGLLSGTDYLNSDHSTPLS